MAESRALRHGLLAATSALTAGIFLALAPGEPTDRISLGTAWLCLLLLAAALVIGPLRVLRGGRPVLNLLQRRDLGIWAAIAGLMHLYAGTVQSMNEAYMAAYVNLDAALAAPTRESMFAVGSIIGFLVGLILLLLLALSNNWIMARMPLKIWKRLQRSAYWVFALTVGHAVLFQLLESRGSAGLVLLVLVTASVVVLQLRGRRAARARSN